MHYTTSSSLKLMFMHDYLTSQSPAAMLNTLNRMKTGRSDQSEKAQLSSVFTHRPAPETDSRDSYLPVRRHTNLKPSLKSPDHSQVLQGSTDVGVRRLLALHACMLLRFSELTANRHRRDQQTTQIPSTATPSTGRHTELVLHGWNTAKAQR